ncbi:MAG: hypothetical protein RLZZ366_329 [Pseudomonadota bacterium]
MTEGTSATSSQLRSLLPDQNNWQRWLSGAISVALLIVIVWKLKDFGFAKAVESLPPSPIFWLAFLGYYFALPLSEWLIFKRLWGLPASGFAALLRKLVSNEILLGYSGEAYFYSWARRHTKIVAAPFGAIKDVSILSAIVGNLMTLSMLSLAWPLVGHVAPDLHPRTIFLSAGVMIGSSMLIFLFKNKIFSLPTSDLRFIFGIHSARIILTTLLSGLMWHTALPQTPLLWLVLLATLQLLVTRLPLVPSKDLVFANLSVFLIGQDGPVSTLIGIIATLILATHLFIGGVLVIMELFEEREA